MHNRQHFKKVLLGVGLWAGSLVCTVISYLICNFFKEYNLTPVVVMVYVVALCLSSVLMLKLRAGEMVFPVVSLISNIVVCVLAIISALWYLIDLSSNAQFSEEYASFFSLCQSIGSDVIMVALTATAIGYVAFSFIVSVLSSVITNRIINKTSKPENINGI